MKREKNWWKHLSVSDIASEDDCVSLMFDLDEDISAMTMQIDTAKGAAIQHGEYSDYEWFTAVNNAMRSAKRTRQAVQERKGQLSRLKKDRHRARIETRFIDIARRVLPQETFVSIMEEATHA